MIENNGRSLINKIYLKNCLKNIYHLWMERLRCLRSPPLMPEALGGPLLDSRRPSTVWFSQWKVHVIKYFTLFILFYLKPKKHWNFLFIFLFVIFTLNLWFFNKKIVYVLWLFSTPMWVFCYYFKLLEFSFHRKIYHFIIFWYSEFNKIIILIF